MSTMETERLLLRPFKAEDFEAFFALHGDACVMRTLQSGAESREEAKATFEIYRQTWARYGLGIWGLWTKAEGVFIGEAGVRVREDIGTALRFAAFTAYQRQGYVSEALRAILPFLFEEKAVQALSAVAEPGNPRSHALLQRFGFVPVDERFKDRPGLVLYRLEAAVYRAST